MVKKIYIIHGWGADSNSDWIPWLKKELENRLRAKTIIYKNKGHFTADNGITEIPEILEFINN